MNAVADRYAAEDRALAAAAQRIADTLCADDRRLVELVERATRGRTRLTQEELAIVAVGDVEDVVRALGRLTSHPQLLTNVEDFAPAGHIYALTPLGRRVLASLQGTRV